jgi:arginine decarboxylase
VQQVDDVKDMRSLGSDAAGEGASPGAERDSGDVQAGVWSPAHSAELYRVAEWGEGFFEIGEKGHLVVVPGREAKSAVDLYEVVGGLRERGVTAPVMIGFPELVERRMEDMAEAFAAAIADTEYEGDYAAVYPIKVNQHRYLVQGIEEHGKRLGFGLEVGSKPELLAVMAMTVGGDDRLIICNGFKEAHYVRYMLLATRLGRRVVAVIENLNELELIVEQSLETGVRPHIGVRLKLESETIGRWRGSTGEKAKFGLTVPGVIQVVERLQAADMLDCLELLHCHMGSQISDIQVINTGLTELARVFVELQRMGANLHYIDVGGGLGVDYDGSQTNSDFSVNYSLQEYATTVVYRIKSVCEDAGVDHPTIVTEAGRAMVGHHSLLVFDVLGCNRLDRWTLDIENARRLVDEKDPPRVVSDLLEAYASIEPDRLLEAYHDAVQAREEARTLFTVGLLNLAQRGLVDRLFWSTCLEIWRFAAAMDPMPEELEELEFRLSDTYF